MAKPKARKPTKALTPPLYGIWLPAAACNAAEARHRGGEWLTHGMLLTKCDKTVGLVAAWHTRAGARRECAAFNERYPGSACLDAKGDYGQIVKIYCRLGDLHGKRGRPTKSDIGRLIEMPDPAETLQEEPEPSPMSFIERLCARRDAKAADDTARKIMDGAEADADA